MTDRTPWTARARRSLAVAVAGTTLTAAGAAYAVAGRSPATATRPAVASAPSHHTLAQASSPTDFGAATLRANLTALLQEHVYLAGIAVTQGVGQGLDSPEFEAAAAALDVNSVNLSGAIESVYGKPAGDQFLALWRKHIGFFVDYTKGKATSDQATADAAKADLDGYRADFGAFLASANPNLTKDAVAQELVPHVESLFAAIDAVVASSPEAFEKLRVAAGHMPMTANVLAGAIAAQFPDQFPTSTSRAPAGAQAVLPRTS